MKYKLEKPANLYLKDTPVENLFINDYMGDAPGDFVKVYLLGLMYAGYGESPEPKIFAKQLSLKEQTVNDAWIYWEGRGLVRKAGGGICFISQKENLYGKLGGTVESESAGLDGEKDGTPLGAPQADQKSSFDSTADKLVEEDLAAMYQTIQRILGRPLGGNEPGIIASWVCELGASFEMVIYAYNYCIRSMEKDHIRYVNAVVKEWAEHGLKTTEDVEEYLNNNDRRRAIQKRIFKALGFARNPSEKEIELINNWIDKDGFTIDKILEACAKTSGISNPNINYVNKVLQGWKSEGRIGTGARSANAPVTLATVSKYYDYIREKALKEAKLHREEALSKIPELKEVEEGIHDKTFEASKLRMRGMREEAKRLLEEQKLLLEKRVNLLKNAGFAPDYMEDKYLCSVCKDTGLTEKGERCSCFEKRMSEAQEWQNSLKE